MLLLDLDLAHVAGMLDDLGHESLVPASNFSCDSLGQVEETTVHPVFPKHTGTGAEWRKVLRNHAEFTVDGPENKENDKEMVAVPEALEVGSSLLLNGSPHHPAEGDEHDISRPAGSGDEVSEDESHEAKLVLRGEASQVVPVGNGVAPGEEEDGPGGENVECDVLVCRFVSWQRGRSIFRYSPNWTMPLSGVRRRREMRLRHTAVLTVRSSPSWFP